MPVVTEMKISSSVEISGAAFVAGEIAADVVGRA
jgi:hypothetical protein